MVLATGFGRASYSCSTIAVGTVVHLVAFSALTAYRWEAFAQKPHVKISRLVDVDALSWPLVSLCAVRKHSEASAEAMRKGFGLGASDMDWSVVAGVANESASSSDLGTRLVPGVETAYQVKSGTPTPAQT